jgi:hypothetical protein
MSEEAARGVVEADLGGKNASFINPKQSADILAAADNVLST